MNERRSSLKVDIWRGGEDGRFERYDVPNLENQTILDLVTWVQRNLEPALAYRFACRVGMCGSCVYLMGPDGKFLTFFPPVMPRRNGRRDR